MNNNIHPNTATPSASKKIDSENYAVFLNRLNNPNTTTYNPDTIATPIVPPFPSISFATFGRNLAPLLNSRINTPFQSNNSKFCAPAATSTTFKFRTSPNERLLKNALRKQQKQKKLDKETPVQRTDRKKLDSERKERERQAFENEENQDQKKSRLSTLAARKRDFRHLDKLRPDYNEETELNRLDKIQEKARKAAAEEVEKKRKKAEMELFYGNKEVDALNTSRLASLNNDIIRIEAKNKPDAARNANSSKFQGLKNVLYLCVGAKVSLTSNIWKSAGLNNGATGIIRDIVFTNNDEQHPDFIVVEMDEYTGPPFFDNPLHKQYVPILPLEICHDDAGDKKRCQYPIRLAYAMSIHKSQGQTMGKVVVHLGTKEASLGLSYVALSRTRHFDDLMIEPCPYERLFKIRDSTSLPPSKAEEARLALLESETTLFPIAE